MFNYVKVNFPESINQPKFIYSAEFRQARYEHETVIVTFFDWKFDYKDIEFGTPVYIELSSLESKREFYGYVHHVNPQKSPGTNHIEVVFIGASMVMKETSQKVYKNITADKVIEQIAKKHKFIVNAVPHPRVYQQIAQAGYTDWELMVKLAKQSGYSLRVQNTELYFQPMLDDFTKYRQQAPSFAMNNSNDVSGSSIYSFKPFIGENIQYEDAQKAAVSVSGVDNFNRQEMAITKQKNSRKTRKRSKVESFDKFDTHVVATDQEIAKYEAEAADNRNVFPYRATLEVIGSPDLKPNMPIYLSGVGSSYNGYWVILRVEHTIVETERNRQTFTTKLEVGIDALGAAIPWVDGNIISKPDDLKGRIIIPGVKSTVVKPKTKLNVSSININYATEPFFSTIKNKPKPKVSSQDVVAPVWRTATASIYSQTQEVKAPAFVINRSKRLGKL